MLWWHYNVIYFAAIVKYVQSQPGTSREEPILVPIRETIEEERCKCKCTTTYINI